MCLFVAVSVRWYSVYLFYCSLLFYVLWAFAWNKPWRWWWWNSFERKNARFALSSRRRVSASVNSGVEQYRLQLNHLIGFGHCWVVVQSLCCSHRFFAQSIHAPKFKDGFFSLACYLLALSVCLGTVICDYIMILWCTFLFLSSLSSSTRRSTTWHHRICQTIAS